MKHLLDSWKKLAKRSASVQLKISLVAIYFIFIIPLSVIVRVFFKNIFSKFSSNLESKSYWRKKEKQKQDLNWAKKQ